MDDDEILFTMELKRSLPPAGLEPWMANLGREVKVQ